MWAVGTISLCAISIRKRRASRPSANWPAPCATGQAICQLYFPDYSAPIVRNQPEGGELMMARWGMPSPLLALEGKKFDPGVTDIRNVKSPHWRRWLEIENRCVVPWTSFSENEVLPNGSRPTVWFAFDETRPLAFFAGIWTRWTSVRKVKEGETTNDIFAFLTTEPNKEVGAIHPKAMPVVRDPERCPTHRRQRKHW
jgi:putative SOS response-associated peptidase YedK